MCDVAERLENKRRAEGRNEGGIQELLGLVKDGFLDHCIAANRAERRYGVKKDEFRRPFTVFRNVDSLSDYASIRPRRNRISQKLPHRCLRIQ